MGSPHFFVGPDDVRGDRVALRGDEAHHASRVLRLRVGETFSAADGSGRVVDAVVMRSAGDVVEGRIILTHEHAPARPVLVLHQGVAKGDRMDFVIQKAVEVGALEIVPFLAGRSVVRWDDARGDRAHRRWSAIALAASKQCRSPWAARVAPPSDGAPGSFAGAALVLHEEADTLLRDALSPRAPDRVEVVVGPEGGLEPGEVRSLEAAGARAVTLGERILRTETAGPVALALVAFSYGSLG